MSELKEYLCIEAKTIEYEDSFGYRFASATKSAPEACMEPVYLKAEADKVIEGLNDKCQMHDFFWEGCGFARRGFKNTIAVSEEFDRLEAENARLRKENKRLKEPSPQRWMAVTSPPKNMREVRIRTADGATIPGHYNYSKKAWYDHDAYNTVEAVGWQELGPVVSEEYAFLEAENAQLKEAVAVYQRNEKLDIRDIHQLKRALWLMTAEWAEGMGLASCNIAIKLSSKERFFYHDEANRVKDIMKYKHRQVVFYKYADYCRAKAEEYK